MNRIVGLIFRNGTKMWCHRSTEFLYIHINLRSPQRLLSNVRPSNTTVIYGTTMSCLRQATCFGTFPLTAQYPDEVHNSCAQMYTLSSLRTKPIIQLPSRYPSSSPHPISPFKISSLISSHSLTNKMWSATCFLFSVSQATRIINGHGTWRLSAASQLLTHLNIVRTVHHPHIDIY